MARLTHRTEAHIRETADVNRLKSAIRAIKQRLGAGYYAQSMASAGSAGGSAHVPVTLGAGTDAALALSGQQLTLADVLTPAEHTAIGDGAPHHAQSHVVLGTDHTDTLAGTVVAGDVIFGNATPKWARLAKSTNGFVLTLVSGLPAWATPAAPTAHNILSASHGDTLAAAIVAGDILFGNATPKLARLAKGNSGDLLTMGASLPAWTAHANWHRIALTCFISGTLTTGNDKLNFRLGPPENCTIEKVRLYCNTAPTGATIIVDIHLNGTTIFTTQGNRPVIAISGFTGVSVAPDVTALNEGSYLTFCVDQIGSTIAGADLTIEVICKVQTAAS